MKHLKSLIDPNGIKDQGDGQISFDQPVVVSSDDRHWDGSKYHVDSMDLSKYDSKLRSDHMYDWPSILGHVTGLAKQGSQLVITGINFLVNQNPYARFAYEMVKAGGATDLSVGVEPGQVEEDGLEHNATLAEISLVGFGNNPAAKINSVAKKAIEQSEEQGIDTHDFRDYLLKISGKQDNDNNKEESDMPKPLKKNDGDADSEEKDTTTVKTETEVETDNGSDAPDNPADAAPQSGKDGQDENPSSADDGGSDNDGENSADVLKAVNAIATKVDKLEKNAFNKGAKEPSP